MEIRVDEPLAWIDVRFEKGTIVPRRFRWKTREHAVATVNARWVDRSVRPIRWGFAVSVESGDVIELCYREGDPIWYVTGVSTK